MRSYYIAAGTVTILASWLGFNRQTLFIDNTTKPPLNSNESHPYTYNNNTIDLLADAPDEEIEDSPIIIYNESWKTYILVAFCVIFSLFIISYYWRNTGIKKPKKFQRRNQSTAEKKYNKKQHHFRHISIRKEKLLEEQINKALACDHSQIWLEHERMFNDKQDPNSDITSLILEANGLPPIMDKKTNELRRQYWKILLKVEPEVDVFPEDGFADMYAKVEEILRSDNKDDEEREFFKKFLSDEIARTLGINVNQNDPIENHPEALRFLKVMQVYFYSKGIKSANAFNINSHQNYMVLCAPFALIELPENEAFACIRNFLITVPNVVNDQKHCIGEIVKLINKFDPFLYTHFIKINPDILLVLLGKYISTFSLSRERIDDVNLPHWENALQLFDCILATDFTFSIAAIVSQLVLIRNELKAASENEKVSENLIKLPALNGTAVIYLTKHYWSIIDTDGLF